MQPKYVHIILLIFSFATFTCGQSYLQDIRKPIIFDHYGFAQGFTGAQALCLEKTRDGCLWIGTEQGLLRYDGHRFKAYRANPYDTTSLSSNYIRKIVSDKHDRLWIIALPDLNIFDPKSGKCKKVKIPIELDNEKKLDIHCLNYDSRNDVMWLGTNKGLLYSQGKDIRLHKETIDGLGSDETIFSIQIDKEGTMWLSGNNGLWRYNQYSCEIKNFHRPGQDPKISSDDGFLSSYYDKKHHIIWVGTWVHGLMKFDIKTQKLTNYIFADTSNIQNAVISIAQSGFTGEDDLLWLATNYGIKTFDIKTNIFTSYMADGHSDINGVPGAGFCFEPTLTEGMWIGTYRGLHRYDPFKQNVKVLPIPLPGGQSDWALDYICFEHGSSKDSIVWFGVAYNSIFRYDLIHKKLVAIPTELKKYCNKTVPYTLYIDSKNILWISSFQKGFIGYDLTKKKIIVPDFNIGHKNKPNILKMVEDDDGNLWLGSVSGMYIYSRNNNEIREQADIRQFLDLHKLSDYAFRFTIDESRKVWIFATAKNNENDAMYCYDPISRKVNLFTQDDYKELKVLKVLENIKSIGNHTLVMTSFNGFSLVNTAKTKLEFTLFENYNEKPLGAFSGIGLDSDNNIWMSTDYGVTRYDPLTNTISDFTYYNSNMGISPKPHISISQKSNTLYIGQSQALNTITLDSLKMASAGNIRMSHANIEKFKIDTMPESGHTFDLHYDQNSMYFEFTNLNFTNSQSNSYQYTLNENATTWLPMADNTLTFNNLGYGEYTLRVKSENSFGLKSPNEYVLHIDIAPPFWRTWWFNGLLIGVISFIIYSLFLYRDNQRKKLERLRQNIARDLHDDMGSTLSHIRMMSEREAMRKDAHQSFKTIADKTGEVMSNMTEIIWSINPKNDSLNNILGKIQEFAIDTLEPMGIDVFFSIDEVPRDIKLNPEDRRNYYLIFKEAINNAAKYSKASQVHFSFKIENRKMMTVIKDNGLGFDPLMIKRGNGLKNMETRAAALNATLNIITNENGTEISLITY